MRTPRKVFFCATQFLFYLNCISFTYIPVSLTTSLKLLGRIKLYLHIFCSLVTWTKIQGVLNLISLRILQYAICCSNWWFISYWLHYMLTNCYRRMLPISQKPITEVKPFKDFCLEMDNRGLFKLPNLPVSVVPCQEKLYFHSRSS